MAGQKPAGRNSGGARRSSGTAGRQAGDTAKARQSQRAGGQGSATAVRNSSGNGAAGGKSRPAAHGAVQPSQASAARARPTGAELTARSGASPLGRLLAPFRSMGGLPLATFILSMYGLGASIYLTIAHYDTQITLACSDKGIVNCQEVTTSPESIVFGIFPVAVLGLAFYVFMVVVNSPWGWRLQQLGPDRISSALRYTRIGSVVLGMCFVLYLVYAELIEIKAICLWCTSVHVATFLIFAFIVFQTSFSTGRPVSAGRG